MIITSAGQILDKLQIRNKTKFTGRIETKQISDVRIHSVNACVIMSLKKERKSKSLDRVGNSNLIFFCQNIRHISP